MHYQNHIHGKWTDASNGATFEQLNPADLSQVTGIWPASPREDAVAAVESAQTAFPAWRDLTVFARAEYLKKALQLMIERREEIAVVITEENGKTIPESLIEIDAAVKEMEFQIHEGLRLGGQVQPSATPGVLAYQTRVPLGVVSMITPWNFPFNVPGRKGVPALIAGNTVVFKPASLTPKTGLKFMELFIDAGLPPGVMNFITGGGGTVGDVLTTHPAVKAVSFTGSTDVGRQLNKAAAANFTRTQLELGGKNPMVVLADADLDNAAAAAAKAAFACAGQWCTSTSRLIVMEEIAEALTEKVLTEVAALKVGPGSDTATTMGPVCGKAQKKNILSYIEIGKAEGATLRCGGESLESDAFAKGCYIAPTVFSDVTPQMRIAQEEIFGPVLSILTVKTFDEAVEVANDVEFGLSSSIYTRDLSQAMRFLEKTDVGLAHVNMLSAHKEPQLTFGGVKHSGAGVPEAGHTGIEFFTEHKTVYIQP